MNHHNPTCFAHHMGLYLIDHNWMRQAKAMINLCPAEVMAGFKPEEAYKQYLNAEPIVERRELYGITASGIAVVPIVGLMMKGSSKFGTSTLQTRQALREAVNDARVKAIMLHMDTPGGSSAGLAELAAEIRRAGESKPLHAHADDLIASAGMWAGSQAQRLSINATGEAGSIGTYMVIEDTSGASDIAGIKVHLINTGEFKGLGVEGVPVTDGQLSYLQGKVNKVQEFFTEAMIQGRNLTRKQVLDLVANGGTWFGKEAKGLGLVDGVESYEEALDRLASRIKTTKRSSLTRKIQMAKVR